MADISMCSDRECPSRGECYRYRAPINPYRQSYMNFERPENADRCSSFCPIDGWDARNLTPTEEVDKRRWVK